MLASRRNLSRDTASFELRKGPTIIGALALLARVCCSATPVAPLFLWGCASTAEGPPNAHDAGNRLEAAPSDDAASETPPREENPITVELLPFWEIPVDSGGFGTPVPLAGAKVCVARKRRHSEPWDSFVPVDGPCTTTEANEIVVLKGVPAWSELVLTAEKDGFVPLAIPSTTGQWDLIFHSNIAAAYHLYLFRRENFSALAPNADLARGQLVVLVFDSDVELSCRCACEPRARGRRADLLSRRSRRSRCQRHA